MVHIKFDPSSVSFNQFVQEGGSDYNYFHGAKPFQRGFGYYQNGAGLSDFLRTLWRALIPVMKSAGKAVGNEALSAGSRVLDRVVEGENVKESLKKESLKGVDNLLEKGGIGRQYGTGAKNRRHKIIPSKKLIGKSVKFSPPLSSSSSSAVKIQKNKRNRSDAFGLY